jgi:hypothetical protein
VAAPITGEITVNQRSKNETHNAETSNEYTADPNGKGRANSLQTYRDNPPARVQTEADPTTIK